MTADEKPKRKHLRQDWAGGLSDLCDRYTSLELQKQVIAWRIEMAMDYSKSANDEIGGDDDEIGADG